MAAKLQAGVGILTILKILNILGILGILQILANCKRLRAPPRQPGRPAGKKERGPQKRKGRSREGLPGGGPGSQVFF